MQTVVQTERAKKALQYLQQNGFKTEIDWDNPTSEDFAVFSELKRVGLLVDRWGQKCEVINRYGPNPHGLISETAIEAKYQRGI